MPISSKVLKSDTAGIEIPELELQLDEGSLNGMYTTVEGLMQKLYDNLVEANPFGSINSDSTAKHHLTNDGTEFSGPSETQIKFHEFLTRVKACSKGQLLPFTLIIDDPLSNSFIGPVPKDAVALAVQAEAENSNACFDSYIDSNLMIQEYTRSSDQDEILGIADMKTEQYEGQMKKYGTDEMQDLPDRLKNPAQRGPDHPHMVGKAPVYDNTIMGEGSTQFAIPSIGKRGTAIKNSNAHAINILSYEENDGCFSAAVQFDGYKKGMVFKNGAKGIGYYTDFVITSP